MVGRDIAGVDEEAEEKAQVTALIQAVCRIIGAVIDAWLTDYYKIRAEQGR